MKIFINSKEIIPDLEFLAGSGFPQFVLENYQTKQKYWLPGANWTISGNHLIVDPATHKIGWTGRIYQDQEIYRKKQYESEYRQAIIGIDLDEVPVSLFPHLVALALPCSIRLSKSGVKEVNGKRVVGLHLLFRTTPATNFFPIGTKSNSAIKTTLLPYRKLIETLGIAVCQANFRTFWLWTNGANRWYSKTDKQIDLVRSADTEIITGYQGTGTGKQVDTSEYSERGKKLIGLLQAARVLPEGNLQYQRNQIWVKQVFEALRGTEFEFQTLSPMRSLTWHSNGFIDISNLTIDIFTNADNKVVARIATRI